MWDSPKSGGGFLWAFIDEGVVRTDLNGRLDVNGVNAPDGVLGPHREKEGSFYAIKDIFSPVVIEMDTLPEAFSGEVPVENRFDFTNLNQCTFMWKLVNFSRPAEENLGYLTFREGTIQGSHVQPGAKGTLKLTLPANWKEAEALLLSVSDPYGKLINTWSWKIQSNEKILSQMLQKGNSGSVESREDDSTLTVQSEQVLLVFDKRNGLLKLVQNKQSRKELNFKNGPVFCGGNADFASMKNFAEGENYIVETNFTGDLKFTRWIIRKNGWVELEYEYALDGTYPFSGISFDYPEDFVLSAKWLGNGPYRVWKNRMQGGTLNVWQNAYNNTVTGYSPWIYPEFKGYFSDMIWIEFNTVEGKFLVACKDEPVFVRLFEFHALPGLEPHPDLPPGDISFLDTIPPTGTKMSTKINAGPETTGPAGQNNEIHKNYKRTLYFYFGALPE